MNELLIRDLAKSTTIYICPFCGSETQWQFPATSGPNLTCGPHPDGDYAMKVHVIMLPPPPPYGPWEAQHE